MYTPSQVELFDHGMASADLFLELWPPDMPGQTILLTGYAPAHHRPGAPPYSKGVPCVISWGDVESGFEMFGADDFLHALEVQCMNVNLPVHQVGATWPAGPQIRSKLSDYLNLVTVAGYHASSAGPPFYVTAFFASPDGSLAHSDRWYIFKGMLHDFETRNNGTVINIRAIEDLRWQRILEYRIENVATPYAPTENIGLPHPVNYGSMATWAHKDFDPGTGPWSLNIPTFPACMNLGVAYSISDGRDPLSLTGEHRHALYSCGLSHLTGMALGTGYQAGVMVTQPGSVSLVNPEDSASGSKFENRHILSTDPDIKPDAMKDLRVLKRMKIREDWIAQATIIPSKEYDGANLAGEAGNIHASFPAAAGYLQKKRITDGDRYSWFADTPGHQLTERRVLWELGQEQNLGAILSVKLFSMWEVVLGTVTVTMRLDWGTGATDYCTGATVFSTQGFHVFTHDVLASPCNLLTNNIRAESWNFSKPSPAGGMILTCKWTKNGSSSHCRLFQVGLLIEYNPAQRFVRYQPYEEDVEVGGYSLTTSRYDKWTDTLEFVRRVLENREHTNQRRIHYAGTGHSADAGEGFPGDLAYGPAPAWMKIVHNPAEILRHMIYFYGGAKRIDVNPSYPTISAYDFNTGKGDPRDFLMAEDDPTVTVGSLDEAVRDACGDENETFKISAGFGNTVDVRNMAKTVQQSIPGLYFFRYPDTHQSDAQTWRGQIGCCFPRVNTPVTYRRTISTREDMHSLRWHLTPRDLIANDIRINYGYSTAMSTYVRSLHHSGNGHYDLGWPINYEESPQVYDAAQAEMVGLVTSSYLKHGQRSLHLDLPLIYRWQEALAIRNNCLRWLSSQRVRILFTARLGIADLLPGDVFQFDENAESHIQCNFPLRHLPNTLQTWNLTKWLVERVTFTPGDKGTPEPMVQAIYAGRAGGF